MGQLIKHYQLGHSQKPAGAVGQQKNNTECGATAMNPFIVKVLISKMERQGKIEQHTLKKRIINNSLSLEQRYQTLFPKLPAYKDMRTERQKPFSKTLFKRLAQVLLAFYRLFDSPKVIKEFHHEMPFTGRLTTESIILEPDDGLRYRSTESEIHDAQNQWHAAINIAALMAKIKGDTLHPESVSSNVEDLSFNPSYFKVDRETTILSEEAQNILRQIPERRFPEDVKIVVNCLQNAGLACFCNYPDEIQKMIAKIAGYMVVTPKRVIIRQGICAEHFYFIIGGRVMISERDYRKDGTEKEKITTLHPGTSFGELDMVNHTLRKFSATSINTVQLLTIERDDILKEFTSYKYDKQIPDHIKFLAQCKFMQFWPVERFGNNLRHCFVYFFKRDVVVLEDSHNTDWIYIMKKGICRVMKRLKKPQKQHVNISNNRLKFVSNANFEQIFKLPLRKGDKDDRILGNIEVIDSIADSVEYPKTSSNKSSTERLCNKKKHVNNDNNYISVQIDLLKCRDVFGLDTLVFDEYYILPATDSVSLVSGGAEIVLLSKKFFIKNASELVKWQVRKQANSYPNNNDLDVKLESQQMWDDYKKTVMSELVSGKIKETPKIWK
ncbi:cyclic nucleotide-binding domain-containing protein 2 [Octopus bimaculoides]|uniref:Cyclic nucleotide-binding domain-containing protein n=1 Tax=Octopus bimaculoides TaxID=37653 RepID=A0A0L8FQZ3_OCTBM|nr:cyclic nucleotide-binding domain-containing protein 2 [Octopus bimaculoides]XP_014787886.1 cyclic nucleotide-binding domain-containing protein 2 [Octopus bimaculoides]XP_014787887.1 cyclic nucleotide-binding domain-containing protein 2 [Octopus bimaculoides]|eukprot:XP_014787885.1 PREDICTED: cyclic nucleotide-binding domain-containing protein 2-like [Octopus bimaculoides]